MNRYAFELIPATDQQWTNPVEAQHPIALLGVYAPGDGRIFSLQNYSSEEKMLMTFLSWMKRRRPCVLYSFDGAGFSLLYLYWRCQQLDVTPSFSVKNAFCGKLHRNAWHVQWPQIEHIDCAILASKSQHIKLDLYTLDAVCRFLGMERRTTRLYNNNYRHIYYKNEPLLLQWFQKTLERIYTLGEFFIEHIQYLSRRFQTSLQEAHRFSTTEMIERLLILEYQQRRKEQTIPSKEQKHNSHIEGGWVKVHRKGIFKNIAKVDIASMYPSIILTYHIRPPHDPDDVFRKTLHALREERLEMKDKRKTMQSNTWECQKLMHKEQTLKTLINSFYGYLGYPKARWGSKEQAAQVTEISRRLVKRLGILLEHREHRLIETDTDGIYFQYTSKRELEDTERFLNQATDEGIVVELEDTYQAMISYMRKNYVLFHQNGSLEFKGSTVKGRMLPSIVEKALHNYFLTLLEEGGNRARAVYRQWIDVIQQHNITEQDVMMTCTLKKDNYESNHFVNELAKKMRRMGYYVPSGMKLAYFVSHNGTTIGEKVQPIEHFSPHKIDVVYYQEQITKRIERMMPEQLRKSGFQQTTLNTQNQN